MGTKFIISYGWKLANKVYGFYTPKCDQWSAPKALSTYSVLFFYRSTLRVRAAHCELNAHWSALHSALRAAQWPDWWQSCFLPNASALP